MFKCQQCEQSGYKPNRIVVERKMVKHVGASAGPRGGMGSQIVREVVICDACAGKIVEAPIERAELVPEKKEVAPGVTFEGQAIDEELAS